MFPIPKSAGEKEEEEDNISPAMCLIQQNT